MGISMSGIKDILGIWVGENESAKYWISVLTELKNRGVKDIYIAAIDGLTGFNDAIKAVFPNTEIQRCIIAIAQNIYPTNIERNFAEILKKYIQPQRSN